jgi:hypothetical protein
MKTKSVNMMIDVEACEALRKTAEADARSVSSLVRLIVRDWLASRKLVPPQQRRREKRQAEATA